MGRVLDQGQAPALAELGQVGDLDRVARPVDRDHGLGALGDECLDRFRVHVEVVAVTADDVAEDGSGAAVADGVGGGDEGERWDDHLVARLDPRRDARKVERSGAAREGEHVLRAQVLGELLLERLCLRAGAEPAGAERRGDGFELLVADPHVEDRDLRSSRLHWRLSRWRTRWALLQLRNGSASGSATAAGSGSASSAAGASASASATGSRRQAVSLGGVGSPRAPGTAGCSPVFALSRSLSASFEGASSMCMLRPS